MGLGKINGVNSDARVRTRDTEQQGASGTESVHQFLAKLRGHRMGVVWLATGNRGHSDCAS
jgi:hypothetical protein